MPHKRKRSTPILPPRPKRRKDTDEQAAEKNPDLFPPIPKRVQDMRGMRFGMLYVRAFAGMDGGHSTWCCECDCGALCKVPRSRLLGNSGKDRGHSQKSCGCRKQDPDVQRAARAKIPASKRREIAAKARAARKRQSRPFAFTLQSAARELRCEPEDVIQMTQGGHIRSVERGGELCFSAGEIRKLAKIQKRNSRHCRALEPGYWKEQLS